MALESASQLAVVPYSVTENVSLSWSVPRAVHRAARQIAAQCHTILPPGSPRLQSSPSYLGKRPNPFTHRQEGPETQGEDLHPKEMSPNAQTKTALGKVGPTGTPRMRAQQPLSLSGRAGDALSESQPTFAARF